MAQEQTRCFTRFGIGSKVTRSPTGRPVVDNELAGLEPAIPNCSGELLKVPTITEESALRALRKGVRSCLRRDGLDPRSAPALGVDVTSRPSGVPSRLSSGQDSGPSPAEAVERCVDIARRAQLDPHVAPAAQLFLGTGSVEAQRFDMSPANRAKIVGTAALVLVVTGAVSALFATSFVRPLRLLTAAAQEPSSRYVRVPVTTRDDTGILTSAFNELSERRADQEVQRKAMVSDIAHELRTPLTNIRGWLEITRDGLVPADIQLLTFLHEEALMLQRVIDDLQDLAAADAGALQLKHEWLRATDILDLVVASHLICADAAGVDLRVEVNANPLLRADPVRLRQALGNLVSNALRHTARGGSVTLAVRHDGAKVVLDVADTGTGISPEDVPHVFDRFWRAEKSRNRRNGGSGLGLAIVRQLVGLHGGEVSVQSEPGVGSVFSLRLPAY